MENNAENGRILFDIDGQTNSTLKSKEIMNGVTNKTKFYFQPIISLGTDGPKYQICYQVEPTIV